MPCSAAAERILPQDAASVFGLGASSSSILPQMKVNSRLEKRPARMPAMIPIGL